MFEGRDTFELLLYMQRNLFFVPNALADVGSSIVQSFLDIISAEIDDAFTLELCYWFNLHNTLTTLR